MTFSQSASALQPVVANATSPTFLAKSRQSLTGCTDADGARFVVLSRSREWIEIDSPVWQASQRLEVVSHLPAHEIMNQLL